MYELQSFVPLENTVRMTLNDLSWEWGIGNFFMQGIPISYSNGRVFAACLSQLIRTKLLADHDAHPLHIYELGAGLGLFAKQLLSDFAQNDPERYQRTHMHLSEFSEEQIRQMQALDLFSPHQNHIDYRYMDGQTPTFTSGEEPDLLYMSYLIDSFPTKNLIYRDGKIYEKHIKTEIPENLTFLDMTTFPPTSVDHDTLKHWIETKNNTKLRILSPQLFPHLVETIQEIPHKDEPLLTELAKLHHKNEFQLNFPTKFIESFSTLLNTLPQKTSLMIHDFGYNQLSDLSESQTTHYGVCKVFAICFPLLELMAHKAGWKTVLTPNKPGHSRLMVVHRQDNEIGEINTLYNTKALEIFEWLKSEMKNTNYVDEETLIEKISHLTQSEKKEYILEANIADMYLTQKKYDKAHHWIDLGLEDQGKIGLYLLMKKAECYRQEEKIEEAFAWCDRVLDSCPNYPDALLLKTQLLLKTRQMDAYMLHVESLFKTGYCTIDEATRSLNSESWNHLITLGLLKLQKGDHKKAGEILNWIIQQKDTLNPPHGVVEKAIIAKRDFLKI